MKPEFKMEFKKLKDKIFKEALPKKLNGKKLTGPALVTLIEEFVKVINSGILYWSQMGTLSNKKIIEEYI